MAADSGPSSRGLRVLVLSWRDLRHPEAGGSERYVHEVARRWVAAGHEVLVVTSRPPGTAPTEVVDGVAHRRAGGRLTVYLHGLWWVAVHGRRTDVVVDVINGLPFGTPLVRRRGVVALLHHVHREQWRMIYPDLRGRLGWFVESRLTPRLYRAGAWVTVSGSTRADLIRLGVDGSRIDVVPNGLAPRPDRGLPLADRGHRVVVLARLVPQKRIEHVLRAVGRLRDELPGIGVDVVGSGWWEPRLREEAARVGVLDIARFHGHVPDDERDRLLGRARVHVLASVTEGWGLAVSEAAAQGTPSIGYRESGGLGESVEDGVTGWLVEDEESLTEVLRQVLTDDALAAAAGSAARERVRELDWGASARAFEGVLAVHRR